MGEGYALGVAEEEPAEERGGDAEPRQPGGEEEAGHGQRGAAGDEGAAGAMWRGHDGKQRIDQAHRAGFMKASRRGVKLASFHQPGDRCS